MTGPKKHHYISAFLLRNFSTGGKRGQLRVHQVPADREYTALHLDVGARNNAHTVSRRMDPSPSFFEDRMSVLESDAATAVRELISSSDRTVPAEVRLVLKLFMVLHFFRHPAHHERVLNEIRDEEWATIAALGGDFEAALHDMMVAAIAYAAVPGDTRSAGHDPARWALYSDHLDTFTWSVVRYPTDSLVVGDRLVCTSGSISPGPNGVSGQASLYGFAGLAWCRRITLALSPRTGLVLSRRPNAPPLRAQLFNRTTVRNSRYFVAYEPSWAQREPELHRIVCEDIYAQRRAHADDFRKVSGGLPTFESVGEFSTG